MLTSTYKFGEAVRIQLPPGALSFVNIYEGLALFDRTDKRRRYGFAVDLHTLPAQLTMGVKVFKSNRRERVMINAGAAKPEIRITGLASPSEELQWLRDRQEELALRNVRPDWLLTQHPLVVDVARYDYRKPSSSPACLAGTLKLESSGIGIGIGIGLGLRGLAIVAKE
jgi:hypothetical protein